VYGTGDGAKRQSYSVPDASGRGERPGSMWYSAVGFRRWETVGKAGRRGMSVSRCGFRLEDGVRVDLSDVVVANMVGTARHRGFQRDSYDGE
jgi:hypothetical protein